MRDVVRNETEKADWQPEEDVNATERSESISALREFFTLLDKWDREQQEEQSKNRAMTVGTTIHRDSKQPEQLGSIMGQLSAENRIKP